ncbi:thioesterase family protein [Streptomyces plumbiresistens]|uniref:Thioesterase n=1 Tax=Streptomyces plumbiresistens TaxID=511811 RepID=A0ABP7SL07_9ACTN
MTTGQDDYAYLHVVRYHEVDPQSHVYHSRYLEIADVGFSDHLAGLLGMPYSRFVEHGFDPALVATQIRFSAPARYEDRLKVYVTPTRVGRSSFDVCIRIEREKDDLPVATVTTTYVNYDTHTERAREIPPAVAAALRKGIPPAGSEA